MSLPTGVSSWTPQFRVSPQGGSCRPPVESEVVALQLNQEGHGGCVSPSDDLGVF